MNIKVLLAVLITVELLSGVFLVAFAVHIEHDAYEGWHYYMSKSRLVVSNTPFHKTVVNQSYAIFAVYHSHTDLVYEISYQIYESNSTSEALEWAMNRSSSVYVPFDLQFYEPTLMTFYLNPVYVPFEFNQQLEWAFSCDLTGTLAEELLP